MYCEYVYNTMYKCTVMIRELKANVRVLSIGMYIVITVRIISPCLATFLILMNTAILAEISVSLHLPVFIKIKEISRYSA